MYANNEIGTIQPIKEMAKAIKQINRDIFFHVDAVQALGKIPINVQDLEVDALSLAAHKIYGPKGTGALYLKKRKPTVSSATSWWWARKRPTRGY